MALFSHVNANTGRIHIHVALTGEIERRKEEGGEGGREREEEVEGRDIFFFLFFSISARIKIPRIHFETCLE